MPAFNEEEGLEKLLARIELAMRFLGEGYHIYIVNDGSRDHTKEVIKCFSGKIPITLFNFADNQGITVVFRKGFEIVLKKANDEDMIVTMDSDNTQTPFVIIDFFKQFSEGSDIVIASRFVPHATSVGIPVYRQLLSIGVAVLLRFLFPIEGVSDYSTFYRAYRSGVVRKAYGLYGGSLISGDGFSSMAGFLVRLCFMENIKVTEVPIRLRYDLKEGGTGMKIFKTFFGYLKMIKSLNAIRKEKSKSET
jgi:dolichol-phosphate mannosyltransferase